MLGKLILPMNYKMTLLHFGFFTIVLLLATWALDKGADWYVNILFTMLCSVTDYLLIHRWIKKALKETPEMSLLVMRRGTFVRFSFIIMFGVIVEFVDELSIATVLLGLVITQVILIVDSIIISLCEMKKNANEKGGKI